MRVPQSLTRDYMVSVKRLLLGWITAVAIACCIEGAETGHRWGVVIHGGAGVIERNSMSPQMEAAYHEGLKEALQQATQVLEKGGAALDAVEVAIRAMEDNPLFNAGRGAVFTAEGKNELDSAIMDGATLKAGSVAGVTRTRHPISLARAVMEKSGHVMLIGAGADAFGKQAGLEQVEPSFFFTERRWQALVKELKKDGRPVPPRPAGAPVEPSGPISEWESPQAHKFGTVGVAAVDRAGNVAAGTSTGGTTAKRWGRVGDSPIIGAGTYASNHSCAVSGTGTGEYFIRLTVARDICALVEYKGMRLQEAADEVIQKQLTALKGDGGVIAIAPDGQMAWSFNTSGMYRARVSEGGEKPVISIYKDEQ
jgi:beta-aspartyl-peptidase (threonine type)